MLSADMYREQILDHFKNPHNYGKMDNPSVTIKEHNPSCGDIVEIQVLVENGKIADIKFHGNGCAISQAATSMLTDEIKGKTTDKIKNMNKDDILEMLGISVSPARLKCALLSLKGIKKGLYKIEGKEWEGE